MSLRTYVLQKSDKWTETCKAWFRSHFWNKYIRTDWNNQITPSYQIFVIMYFQKRSKNFPLLVKAFQILLKLLYFRCRIKKASFRFNVWAQVVSIERGFSDSKADVLMRWQEKHKNSGNLGTFSKVMAANVRCWDGSTPPAAQRVGCDWREC